MTFDPRQTYVHLLGVPEARRFRCGDGRGVRVFAVEYSVQEGHPDIDENIRVIGTEYDPAGSGLLGHGTRTAGVISGDAGDGGIEGIAPGAEFIFCAAWAGVVPWLEMLDLARPGDVVSFSVSDLNTFGEQRPIHHRWNDQVRRLEQKGADVFMAAGNSSYFVEVSERAGTVVGATNRDGTLPLASSGHGPGVAYCAPGEGVWTTEPGGHGNYGQTSAATPQVAACKAILTAIGREYDRKPVMIGREVSGRVQGRIRTVGALPDVRRSLMAMFDWPVEADVDGDSRIGFGDFLAGIKSRKGTAAYRWLIDVLGPNYGRRWPEA